MYITNRTFQILALGSMLTLALQGCAPSGGADLAQAEEEKDDTPAIPVEVAQVKMGDVNATYSGTATLEAEDEASIVAKVGGEIMAIFVEEGEYVKAGQVLAKIDDARLRLEVTRARAALGKLEQEFNRNRELYQSNLVSSDAFESLQYDVAGQKAALDLAALDLQYTEIQAPFDGVIATRYIKVGNVIQVNETAFDITDLDTLLARLYVPERELHKFKKQQLAMVSVDALPNQNFSGIVDRISPVVDPNTGTFRVTLLVHDEGEYLKPGMFGRVSVIYDVRENTLLAPRNAILTEDTKSSLFVVRESKATRQEVVTGYSSNGSIEILQGVELGDQIVTVGQNSLKDGAKVAIINANDTSESDVMAVVAVADIN